MNKIEFFRTVRGEDVETEALIETGMPMVIFSEDKSMKLMLAYYHLGKTWICTEIYTGLLLETGKTRAELFDRIAQTSRRVFEIERTNTSDRYWDQMHRFVAAAYKKLDEARPSGLFGKHSLSQELIEYITAPTFKEAITNGKKE